MTVRAKFKVAEIRFTEGNRVKKDEAGKPVLKDGREQYEPCKLATIIAHPVYGNGDPNHENTKFWQASPGGKLELNCVNASATEVLNKIGQEFYMDMTPSGAAPELT